jgi:hypothetical protein
MEQTPLNPKEVSHGEPPSQDLVNGPLEERNCTDILCCLLFIAGFIGMIAVGSIGFAKGKP